jgi:hypothetical protein
MCVCIAIDIGALFTTKAANNWDFDFMAANFFTHLYCCFVNVIGNKFNTLVGKVSGEFWNADVEVSKSSFFWSFWVNLCSFKLARNIFKEDHELAKSSEPSINQILRNPQTNLQQFPSKLLLIPPS